MKALRPKPVKKRRVSLTQDEIDALHAIGSALTAEPDLDRLLVGILGKCRWILRADAGTLFLAEAGGGGKTQLRFMLAQNDSVPVDLRESVMPVDRTSLAGYVAATRSTLMLRDVYRIPTSYPFRFNPEIDRRTGYRSKSVLSVPMVDHRDQLIGVVQVWNKKGDGKIRCFTESDRRLLASLSAQAAVAIENARLYGEIRELFEGFIRASALAIEARDPSTRGHSERVAALTVGLAEAVRDSDREPFRGIRYTPDQLREIEYAALLHDFGKIGIRESLLLKSKKLHDWEWTALRDRFDLLRRNAEIDALRRKIDCRDRAGIDAELSRRLEELRSIEEALGRCNEPTVLPEAVESVLDRAKNLRLERPDGSSAPLLSDDERRRLSVPKGSLSPEERAQVEEHVGHTYRFLARIPWTRDLRNVPSIAYAHHERPDGTGYPEGIAGSRIPLPSKMMAIADMFDALASRDRPYKNALPVERALEILRSEASAGRLDADLVELFIECRIHLLAAGSE